jgi:prepilin-type N-terminal cleavage/methylation domain-containing protein
VKQQSGFTLLEAVLALLVFSVGALGLAATTATITRSLALASVRERSARVAAARIETLRSLTCAAMTGGSEVVNGITSSWSATVTGQSVAVSEAVTYKLGPQLRTDSYPSIFRCK